MAIVDINAIRDIARNISKVAEFKQEVTKTLNRHITEKAAAGEFSVMVYWSPTNTSAHQLAFDEVMNSFREAGYVVLIGQHGHDSVYTKVSWE